MPHFAEQLSASGIQVKIRFRKGDKISAACGQLRRLEKGVDNSSFTD
ncbi:MAG: hypothetical protein LBT89_02805 [Planctomycetaceae bacterium]|nr:hypothetical protein [Planctomycetaceae bacterium]